ncbi:Domain in Tre-2, BUB2p, and Cdc16p putative Rab-GAPs [Teratosphaeria destructans]|uniref:GTPase-activating protein GYP5 n=1 Tax=Teratosphaeria destructans TaxID=418781 RepID=A0A9W7SS74_9PEZI|nr:Domain in Tre-2, BUB2p, and Cdc16p putative Rab-GAPs [Teratosphaeria destructans]
MVVDHLESLTPPPTTSATGGAQEQPPPESPPSTSSPPDNTKINTSPTASIRSSVSEEERQVNRAPGILDRRRSTRPSKDRSTPNSSGGRKRISVGPRIRISLTPSMAEVAAEMRARGGDIDEGGEHFEDAAEESIPSDEPEPAPAPASAPAPMGKDEQDSQSQDMDGTPHEETKDPDSKDLEVEDVVTRPRPQSFAPGDEAAHTQQAQTAVEEKASTLAQPALVAGRERERSVSPGETPSRAASPTKHMQGLSGDFAVPALAPPSTADRQQAIEDRHVGERPGLAKKASSGLGGFLSRMGSIRKARSPPAPKPDSRFNHERRNTGASLNGALAPIADGAEAGTAKLSLQDQFQNLRRQEEHTVTGANGLAVTETDGGTEEKEDGALSTDTTGESQSRVQRTMSAGAVKTPPLNPSLPPGTASGLTAGLPEESRQVDWDFWQEVVYEGPAAMQRKSGAELRHAIASGIPPAIRGVVWQALAESKNDELENVYRTLKARGTDESSRPPPLSRTKSQSTINGASGEKGSGASSRSSSHSGVSTPTTSRASPPPGSFSNANGHELRAKLLAEKQKRESATLAKLEKAIRRDLGTRTSYSKYTQSAGLQDGLFGVCKAYALFDEGVGYAQGINFVAMPLLFNMSEEEAFTLLVRLMSKYDLRSMFTRDMEGLHMRLYQFERLLEDLEPALYCHLKRRHVGPQLYATQWFLTLFAYRFPLQLVLRVYDLILSEGLTAILKFGIVLMKRNRNSLLEMKDMSHLTTFLKEKLFDVYIDRSPSASALLDSGFFGSVMGSGADKEKELYRADEMVRDACEITITEAQLASYVAEWEETSRLERERNEEIEMLRSTNATLSARVKALEERTQAQDAEHVTIAGELVSLKVQNDALLDENEGLKMKVEELSKFVDVQPAEVENRLKEEMDRIMQRNIEVQNENRSLKEEAEEMEAALVEAKMQHAQVRSDHDALQQKLASVQSLLGSQ